MIFMYTGRAHCDLLINNICGVFNRQLLDARDSPIVSALEYVREYLMKRIVLVQKVIAKSDGPLTPSVTKLFNKIKDAASKYIVEWNGANLFEVKGPWGDQCVVNLEQRVCSCRKWEISGLPCKHAIAAIQNMGENGMTVGLPELWVHQAYRLETWKKQYSFKVNPINGRHRWEKHVWPTTLLPPKIQPQIGRPQKKRKKSVVEVEEMVKNGKLSKKGKTVTCCLCKQQGHNKRTCKNVGAAKNAGSSGVSARGAAKNAGSSGASARGGANNAGSSGVGQSSQAQTMTPKRMTKNSANRKTTPTKPL